MEMNKMLLKNANVFLRDSHFEKADLRIENGRITEIGCFPHEKGEDLSGKMLIPGLIDIHSHGRDGSDYEDGTPEAVEVITRSQLRQGVTSMLATTVTQSEEVILQMLNNIATAKVSDGAEILGINLEGPFISAKACGAQPPEYCINPDPEVFKRYQNAARGMIRLVTVAPELPGALEFISHCGVKTSAGHTTATYHQFNAALQCGLSSVTHLFNGMPPLHHREPGVVGGALLGDNYAEMICDGIHLDAGAVWLAYKLKGARRLIMISDSMSGAGLADGLYELGRNTVTVKDGVARIANGSLAGSTSSLSKNMRNMLSWGIPPEDIIRMCTSTPAAMLGIATKGILTEGADADFDVMEEGFLLSSVYKAGKKMF